MKATPPILETIRKLRTQFAAAHREGTRSLEASDYEGFSNAIHQERAIVLEQQRAIKSYLRRASRARGGPLKHP